MINLDHIKGHQALSMLEGYTGINPYIRKLRNEYLKNKKIQLTDNQSKYILDNHDKDPLPINRVINITKYLGEELQKQDNLGFIPERILVEFLLADTEKSFHVYGKLKQNQLESSMYWLPKTQVLDDIYFEPINIEVDFSKYNDILSKTNKKLYLHQEEGIKFLLSRNGCILGDSMGLGKVLANDTPVLTLNGWVKNGELKIGDYVIGSNGKPTKVIGVYPQPEKKFYNITLTDGTIVESCDEHLWAVQTTSDKYYNNNKFVVKELKEIMNDLTYGTKNNLKWYLPMVKPVEFPKADLIINPYVIGCLLGDGGLTTKSVRFSSTDYEIINEINKNLPKDHILKKINKIDYRLCSNFKSNIVINELKKIGLMGLKSDKKFIPNNYLYSNINDRINILQGLLDTDGYCDKKGTIQFYTVSEKLCNNVKELVQSLGGVARMSSKIGKYKLPNGEVKICKKCFILTINLPSEIKPFKLTRKIERLNKNKKYNPSRGIKSVNFSRLTTGQCIMVEAEDHLYVMDQYVVTHNTTQSIIAALESDAKKILVVCPSSAKINWEREINVFCDETAIVNGKNWEESKFTIINYDILKNFHTIESNVKENNTNRELVNAKFDLVIVDEAHYLKNNDSIRGKIMAELSIKYNIPKFWLLSGTPVANRPMDFFNLLKIIKSPIANNWKHFATRYCDGKQFFRTLKNGRRKQIWLTDGASNLEELSMKTKNSILRRLKENVLDMPDKIITPMYHKLNDTEVKQYEALWDEYIEKRKLEGKKTNTLQKELVELVMLRKFIAMQSIPYTIEMAENAIEMGCKVIIFTNFTEELEALHDHFGKISVKHNGPMTAIKKQHSVDQFQNNPKIKVFVGNIVSAGIAITLTEASVVIFNSFAWVSGLNEQAEDRCVFKDQLVMTANGYKKIQNIKLNDFVYTHNGNFKKVINTHTHLERKKIKVNINALGFNKDLILTHDHKLYVYNSLTSNFEWVEAGSLNIYNHKLTFKCNNQPVQRKKELEVKNYVNENFNNNFGVKQHNGMLKRLPDKVELTNDLLYAFGFFIAEGWVNDISINKSSNVSICQKITNKKMYDASTYIIEIIKNAFKINKHSEYIDKQNVKTCTIHSKNLAKNFIEWFGKGVKNKKLPIWVDELDNEQLINLLNGYYHGDGYKRKSRQQAITVSPFLGSQLVRYNTNLGRNVSLKLVDTKLNDEFYYDIEYSEVQENKSNKIVKIDNYITYPIISIGFSKPKRGEERVYDLSVEDDHSFVVGNYNVHNCYRIGQKNNVNIYYQLFLDTISLRMWETLNYKKDVISTILGEKIYSEEEIEKIMEKLLNNEL